MAALKAGVRLRSAVCSTELMVIAAPADAEISCGGAPMVNASESPPPGLSMAAGADAGTKLGKRYVNDAADLELLCIKGGDGSLAVGGVLLKEKAAKKLPSSD